jgi:hypothetical protein
MALACLATMAMAIQPTVLMPRRTVRANHMNNVHVKQCHHMAPASHFAPYQGKCVGGITDDMYVSSAADAEHIIESDPATYPAYLLQRYPDGAQAVWLCSANYGEQVFDAGAEWTLCVYQGQNQYGDISPTGAGDSEASGRDQSGRDQYGQLDFEQYKVFMSDRGERLTQSDLRRRFDELNTDAQQSKQFDSYDDYARFAGGRDEFLQGGSAASYKGGAYNYAGQQTREITPLLEFLRWQEWYVNYCKLRGIGQHPTR